MSTSQAGTSADKGIILGLPAGRWKCTHTSQWWSQRKSLMHKAAQTCPPNLSTPNSHFLPLAPANIPLMHFMLPEDIPHPKEKAVLRLWIHCVWTSIRICSQKPFLFLLHINPSCLFTRFIVCFFPVKCFTCTGLFYKTAENNITLLYVMFHCGCSTSGSLPSGNSHFKWCSSENIVMQGKMKK